MDVQFVRIYISVIEKRPSIDRLKSLESLDETTFRLLVAMQYTGIGVTGFASARDIRTALDQYTHDISHGLMRHHGDPVETRLENLADQQFVSRESSANAGVRQVVRICEQINDNASIFLTKLF